MAAATLGPEGEVSGDVRRLFSLLDRDSDALVCGDDYRRACPYQIFAAYHPSAHGGRYLLRAMSFATLSDDCPQPPDDLIVSGVFGGEAFLTVSFA